MRSLLHTGFCFFLLAGVRLAGQPNQALTASKYTGPGACSSPSCHGAIAPRSGTSVIQNEYSTWAVKDKHSRAASALTNDTGKRIGHILGINPETSDKCLDCHALNVKKEDRARSFEEVEGVSCENCHGPASEWLGPHTTQGWTHQQSIAKGMADTRDPIKFSEICLSCHLGTASKTVDHQMIAAGHPDLYFEVASFSNAMPKHWKDRDADPWFNMRVLVTGQIIQLRENARRIARDAARFWPEYSELDCFACHHLINAKLSWRQERGYHGHRPGNPAWNMASFAALKPVLEELDPESCRRLDGAVSKLNGLVSDITADRTQIAAAAGSAAEIAGQVAGKAGAYRYDETTALRLMKRIDAAAQWIAGLGERPAEQTSMVTSSLVLEYCRSAERDRTLKTQLDAAVSALFQILENPAAYLPQPFEERIHAVGKLMR